MEILKRNQKLKIIKFSLQNNKLNNSVIIKLLEQLNNLKHLEYLYLNVEWNFNLTQISLEHIKNFLKIKKIKQIKLFISYQTRIYQSLVNKLGEIRKNFLCDKLEINSKII